MIAAIINSHLPPFTKIIFFFFLTTTFFCCKNEVKEKDKYEFIDEEVIVNDKKPRKSTFDTANKQSVLDSNFIHCIPKDFKVTDHKGYRNQIAGDFDADGIYEICSIVRKDEIVKLSITERDTLGNCTKQFTTGNLTTKLIDDKPDNHWQIMNSTTTRFGGPEGVSTNAVFTFKSKIHQIELTFYGDKQKNDYYLLKSEYTIFKNNEYKEGQITVIDFLKQEKKIMSRTGSRKNMIVEKTPNKMYTLPMLDYKTLMDLIK